MWEEKIIIEMSYLQDIKNQLFQFPLRVGLNRNYVPKISKDF